MVAHELFGLWGQLGVLAAGKLTLGQGFGGDLVENGRFYACWKICNIVAQPLVFRQLGACRAHQTHKVKGFTASPAARHAGHDRPRDARRRHAALPRSCADTHSCYHPR